VRPPKKSSKISLIQGGAGDFCGLPFAGVTLRVTDDIPLYAPADASTVGAVSHTAPVEIPHEVDGVTADGSAARRPAADPESALLRKRRCCCGAVK
jgi:hypothetical protein